MSVLKSIFAVALCFASLTVHADSVEPDPFTAVQNLFAAVSAKDEAAMRRTVTNDFQLLEVGEIWDMDKFVSAVVGGGRSDTKRRNFFSVIRREMHDGRAWVSYWNKAIFETADGQVFKLIWLESAVFVKAGDGWRIEMLHSTKLGNNQTVPQGVMMKEFVAHEP